MNALYTETWLTAYKILNQPAGLSFIGCAAQRVRSTLNGPRPFGESWARSTLSQPLELTLHPSYG
jgi:hypothetical protein